MPPAPIGPPGRPADARPEGRSPHRRAPPKRRMIAKPTVAVRTHRPRRGAARPQPDRSHATATRTTLWLKAATRLLEVRARPDPHTRSYREAAPSHTHR